MAPTLRIRARSERSAIRGAGPGLASRGLHKPQRTHAGGGVHMDRILATHTGSLIRPPDLLAFLAAKERGQERRRGQHTSRRLQEGRRRRRPPAGRGGHQRRRTHGEMGKASWITYLYERVSGLEVRPIV